MNKKDITEVAEFNIHLQHYMQVTLWHVNEVKVGQIRFIYFFLNSEIYWKTSITRCTRVRTKKNTIAGCSMLHKQPLRQTQTKPQKTKQHKQQRYRAVGNPKQKSPKNNGNSPYTKLQTEPPQNESAALIQTWIVVNYPIN
jgi:hypothetical protein